MTKLRLVLWISGAALVFIVLMIQMRQAGDQVISASIELAEAMGGDTTGYDRADEVKTLEFPKDFGPHPGFKTEWWYYTGNVDSDEGRPFGYELTIFRTALAPPDTLAVQSASDWSSDQLYMGHFALVDVASERFYAFERLSRGALGLAGAQSLPYRVWLEDWSVESAGQDLFPTRLRARQDGVEIDLTLESVKPIVLQGDNGLDQKGEGPGNASYYYSFTRLAARGTIRVDDITHTVQGSSWKDHEWSTSALGPDEVGWNWFALQLSDGRDIMFYELRRSDDSSSPFTKGMLIESDGSYRALSRDEVEIEIKETWTSPHSRATYPSGWQLRIPGEQLEMRISPRVVDQELNLSVRYWEGAVSVEGTANGESITGKGFVELTGYDQGGRSPR